MFGWWRQRRASAAQTRGLPIEMQDAEAAFTALLKLRGVDLAAFRFEAVWRCFVEFAPVPVNTASDGLPVRVVRMAIGA